MKFPTKGITLSSRILQYLQLRTEPTTMGELYEAHPENLKHSIRARVYENLGTKIERVAKGTYKVIGDGAVTGVVEHGDSLEFIVDIRKAQIKYDMVFLDIPYRTGGQRGGNRNIVTFPHLSISEFDGFMGELSDCLRDELSQVYFMITTGKDSAKMASEFKASFSFTGLHCAGQGEYVKLWPNGNRMNMGKYPMPPELIQVYSKSGELRKEAEDFTLDFNQIRPNGYPTQKPLAMLKQMVRQSTKIGQLVFDPFAGSGMMGRAARELGRHFHLIEKTEAAIPIIQKTLTT